MNEPPDTIVCVDCGGTCRLLTSPPAEGFPAGAIVAYRCIDCHDRWDLVWEGNQTEAPEVEGTDVQ